MRKASLLLAAFIITVSGIAQKKSTVDQRLVGVDTALSRLLKDWNAAGFAVAVVEKNKIIYSKGFGFRDAEKKLPVTPNTLFQIGSCTKAFTTSLMGILEKEGSVKLDKKVTSYLPDLSFYNDNMNNIITIRDMMCHRTGLPRHDFSWYLFASTSRDSLMKRVRYQEPTAEIRERFQYNNFMFLLQGMIAEKVTGKSWEENIKEKIFTPLGMKRSVFSIDSMAKDADAAFGYRIKNDSTIKKVDYYRINAMGPAGSITSSVTEMANWVMTWINGGKFGGKDVIPGTFVREAMSAQMVSAGGVPGQVNPDLHFSNYGLGWFLSSYRGHYRVEHGGNIDGFTASTSFFPSDSIGIIVLANQDASSIPSIARNILVDRMLKLKPINWAGNMKADADKAKKQQKEEAKSVTSSQIPGTKPSHPLSAYEGIFSHAGYGEIHVFLKNDSLLARTVKDSLWLRHFHYDIFEAKGYDREDGVDTSVGGQKLNFRFDEMGKIESLETKFEYELKPLVFSYRPAPKSISKEDLEKYAGEYEIGGMTVKIYLKEDVLWMFVPGQPEYETISTGNHGFSMKTLTGYSIKFILNDKGEVTTLELIQPNGNFKAERKKK